MTVRVLSARHLQTRQINEKSVAVFSSLKECVSLEVSNGELCLRVPIIGDLCIDVPGSIQNGTIAEACVEFAFPACFKITVTALEQTIFQDEFGICGSGSI